MAEQQNTESTTENPPRRRGRMVSFARRHPGLTVIGAAAAGLLGGVEVAAGMLIGATVAAIVGPRSEAGAPERNDLRERARAVVQAARGELHPKQEQQPQP